MQELLIIIRALADPSRVRILLLVRRMELSVGELAAVLEQSQPRVSRHIRILADAGLVRRAKEGAWVFVRLGLAAVTAPVLAAIDAMAPAAGAADQALLAAVRAERASAADAWFAAHAADWDRERSAHVAAADIEAAIVAALAERPLGRLVDVGTGTGRMVELLGRDAAAALGIDRSPEMLRLARGRIEAAGLAHAEVRHGDMYALPAGDSSVDTVVLHQVLHFADDPAAVIAEAARVLAPAGRLLLIDFMPHGREELRQQQRHVRLGFADGQPIEWMLAAGLTAQVAARLPAPDALGVTLWLGQKSPADRHDRIAERQAA
jgi:ArsR family transcriptional regulator